MEDHPFITIDFLASESGEDLREEIVSYVLNLAEKTVARLSADPVDRETILQDAIELTVFKLIRKLKDSPEQFADLAKVKEYLRAVLRSALLSKKQVPWTERVIAYNVPARRDRSGVVSAEDQERSQQWREVMASELTERELQVLEYRFISGMSVKDIAAKLKVTPGEVSRAALSGTEKLRRGAFGQSA
ncbi:MAG: sigma-70 family RNA polymerase sigma factor [Chloroflexi bacterium]|nr:sigma-70 family RNA polymerase sigma factor [Chloroflexota bacterium]